MTNENTAASGETETTEAVEVENDEVETPVEAPVEEAPVETPSQEFSSDLYVVDHSGFCDGISFTQGVPIKLTPEVVTALGESATPVNEVAKEVSEAPKDKMVKKTKVVTK